MKCKCGRTIDDKGCFGSLPDSSKCSKCCAKDSEARATALQKIRNASRSIANYAKGGFANVSNNVQEERMLICQSCEFFDKTKEICLKCGCYLSIKTRWASESCPEGKWEEISAQDANPQKKCGGCSKKRAK